MKVTMKITKGHIVQLEKEIMGLVPSGKSEKAFKQVFDDFKEAIDFK